MVGWLVGLRCLQLLELLLKGAARRHLGEQQGDSRVTGDHTPTSPPGLVQARCVGAMKHQ
eukprot:CAMPEP_0175879158 /NCGR_PEP_ID=MMETSP0107_2-20121207/41606_1 /TAXON_ID=195067 ORGANISM="Goniomonas pacifica, Strain CCMP1869" /NCGR_SAMPLE_ID=MMETSP0107_2 /ASSEMBLY_ACC=CAM_ASM_000203 /LENGTH=59 /DNA_ID=CAMNT_0017198759 /DNA_START=41 /DNA_END=220 /DNA_ORIENTATION=+